MLRCVAMCCGALRCVAVCYSMLQDVTGCCSTLQYVAVCCSMLQRIWARSSRYAPNPPPKPLCFTLKPFIYPCEHIHFYFPPQPFFCFSTPPPHKQLWRGIYLRPPQNDQDSCCKRALINRNSLAKRPSNFGRVARDKYWSSPKESKHFWKSHSTFLALDEMLSISSYSTLGIFWEVLPPNRGGARAFLFLLCLQYFSPHFSIQAGRRTKTLSVHVSSIMRVASMHAHVLLYTWHVRNWQMGGEDCACYCALKNAPTLMRMRSCEKMCV